MPDRIPLLARQPAPRGPRASSGDFVDSRGTLAIGGAVRELADVSARIFDNTQRSRAARAAAEAANRLREKAAEIALEPDPATHEARFTEEAEKARGEFAEGLAEGYRDLYEQEVDDAEEHFGLAVRTGAYKLALDEARANDDWTLGELANEAARARDDAARSVVEGKVAGILGTAKARGQWDQADVDKRLKAYRKAVADAALDAGLAADPAATQKALEAQAGPFAHMDEPDRQAGILAAEKRIAAAERSGRAALRYQQAQQDRAEQEAVNEAGIRLNNAARTGQLTPEMLAAEEANLVATPGGVSMHKYYSELLAQGGQLPPGGPDAEYWREVVFERANEPGKFVKRTIDPAKAGNKFEELVASQGSILRGQADPTEPYWRKVSARWDRVAETAWYLRDLPKELADEFWLRAEEAKAAFYRQPDKLREPNGVEMEEILDGVVLDFTKKHGGTEALSGRPLEGDTQPDLQSGGIPIEAPAGVRPADLERVDGQLRALGRPITPENRQRMYDAAVAAGLIVP